MAKLDLTGEQATLNLRVGAQDKKLVWQVSEKQNYAFIGLAEEQQGDVVISVNSSAVVNWSAGKTLYEVFKEIPLYEVKDESGKTLAQTRILEPILLAQLEVNDTHARLRLTTNKQVNELSWDVTEKPDYLFAGLSTDKQTLFLPLNINIPVNWNTNTELYEFYVVDTTFRMTLYQNSAEAERVDKTDYLKPVGTLRGVLREDCEVISPSILITAGAIPTFNYAYMPMFNRYYFVDKITSVNKNLWRVDFSVDVLMSYKAGIGDLTAIIGRQENDYNDRLVDTEIPTEKQVSVTYEDINNDILDTQLNSDAKNFLLVVVGAS